MSLNLLNRIKVEKVAAATTAGTSDVTSSSVDMAGFDGVVFVTTIATPAANNNLQAQGGAASNGSDAADIAGTKTGDATTPVVVLDLYRPLSRYNRTVIKRGTSTAVGEIYALKYSGRVSPTANNTAGTILSTILASPEPGTP